MVDLPFLQVAWQTGFLFCLCAMTARVTQQHPENAPAEQMQVQRMALVGLTVIELQPRVAVYVCIHRPHVAPPLFAGAMCVLRPLQEQQRQQ
jgi:hypothetical protein